MSDEKQKAFNQKYPDLVYIFKGLLDEGIFKSFDQFIEASKIIFEKYNNQNNKNQRLTIVDIGFTKQQLQEINEN
ncbi:unnamed protein product (macronuclear) [Paramecium tetraurelia]|uniref:Uncharacterized protein n=1 Tax=Paramecium tetraurelia TaxID=5888 RepID=A0D9T0_PARTE|nr:uncharacterized protein GSPATT00014728001 [Paramecium tetraurelia]CAK79797.1 unnamed protein product [Paramecium tetraurelia]|eukprot:XP_001447194.1 hypothetical protein (macronuclear) [Paramecium tetraurelia strain d4-2]